MTATISKRPNNTSVGLKYSTNAIPLHERSDWIREVICREYAQAELISPAHICLSQDFIIFPRENLQLSIIESSAISLERLPREPHLNSQDAYFVAILLSGEYLFEQNGREVLLQLHILAQPEHPF